MQIDEAGIARRLRIAVGHADDGGFLQAQHIVDVVRPIREERQFGRTGIAEDASDVEGAQEIERRLLDGDGFGCLWFSALQGQMSQKSYLALPAGGRIAKMRSVTIP